MNKRFLIIFAIIIVGFLGLVMLGKKNDKSTDNSAAQTSSHTQGTGAVTFVEFGDFQCPACGSYYPLVKAVKEKYGDQITFQFKHFPIVSIHPNAMSAHRAAEAAGMQGKFFEMHDMLYERQQAWTSGTGVSSIFEGYAAELGLDMEKYKQDVVSSVIQGIINADIKEGQALPVSATPTFVIDGKKIENSPRDVDGFSALIDEALKAKSQQ